MASRTHKAVIRVVQKAFWIVLIIAACALGARAEEAAEKFTLQHSPPDIKDLTAPGDEINLTVSLQKSRDINLRVRLLAVIDGRLVDIPSSRAILSDSDDAAQYDFKAFSPLAEISYQFIAYNTDGSVVSSKRFNLRRTCIPRVEPTDLSLDIPGLDISQQEKFELLLEQARGLEIDISNYEKVLQKLKILGEKIKG